MKNFIFKKDYANSSIHVICHFKAPLRIIWDAFTNPVTLEKWLGPKPYQVISQEFDFTEGGHWLYCMLSPKGEKYWSITRYKKIRKNSLFEASDAFCDENGIVNPELPLLNWEYQFSEANNITEVQVEVKLASKQVMKQLLNMGFEEGYRISLNQLTELLG